jgi:hypothetical protein
MDIAACAVSAVSALVAVVSVWYARSSDRSAKKSAAAAETTAIAAGKVAAASEVAAIEAGKSATAAAATAALDADRRHSELTPRLRVICKAANPGSQHLSLQLFLVGPPDLGRLDGLTVSIRDDHPWRGQGTPLAGGPTPEQVAAQIWGPWRFTPGTGPGADPVRGIPGADETGRITPTGGMPMGEGLPFSLEPTWPPQWSQQAQPDWLRERGTLLRLRLECIRDGEEPWILTGEVDTAPGGRGRADIPGS